MFYLDVRTAVNFTVNFWFLNFWIFKKNRWVRFSVRLFFVDFLIFHFCTGCISLLSPRPERERSIRDQRHLPWLRKWAENEARRCRYSFIPFTLWTEISKQSDKYTVISIQLATQHLHHSLVSWLWYQSFDLQTRFTSAASLLKLRLFSKNQSDCKTLSFETIILEGNSLIW